MLCDVGAEYIHRTRHARVARTDIAAPGRIGWCAWAGALGLVRLGWCAWAGALGMVRLGWRARSKGCHDDCSRATPLAGGRAHPGTLLGLFGSRRVRRGAGAHLSRADLEFPLSRSRIAQSQYLSS